MVCAIPAIHSIRRAYPDAHLVLLTSPGKRGAAWAGDLVQALDIVDEISLYHAENVAGWRNRLRWIRELRARRFEVWIELPPVMAQFSYLIRNLLTARIAGARWARGWRMDTIGIARQAQSEAIAFPDEVDRLLNLLGEIGIPGDDSIFPLALPDRYQSKAQELLAGISDRQLIAIAPGAKRPTNRWPVERFTAVARQLAAQGFGIAVIGGAGERDLCAEIAVAAGDHAINLAGQCSLAESCAVLRACVLLVCNDSGVQHMAAAVSTCCLSLFAARDFGLRWRPHGPNHAAIRKSVPCHTCLLELCPYDNRCLKLIEVDEVIQATYEMLKTTADEPGPAARLEFA
ncbi:MAG: glycosyltransferase family 9 protein [Candidatus Binataceae bacterium]|nr:glycosyltransferase family 9 protein [Candidatus Binataceae bacterium]